MSYQDIISDLRKLSAGEKPSRIPLMPLGLDFNRHFFGMNYHENRTDLNKIVRMNCDAVNRFGYDWALIFPDDYVEWEPLGLEMANDKDQPAAVKKYLPAEPDMIRNMVLPDPSTDGRMPIQLEAIRQIKENLGESVAVAGRIAAPFSALGLLWGVSELMISPYEKPDLLKEGLEKICDFIIEWGLAQQKAGADILWFGDCLSSSAFISPELMAEFSVPYSERVARELKNDGVFLIYHACEKSMEHIKLELALPVDAVNLGDGVDLPEVRRITDSKMCLSGNLDPIAELKDAMPEEIYEITTNMLERNKEIGAYIFCTSEGITENTPVENVDAMMAAAGKCAVSIRPR